MATCPTCEKRYPDETLTCADDGETLLPDVAFASMDRELAVGQGVGEYRIEGKLGQGGFGTVYRAVHPLIGKAAAVKVLSRQYSSNPQMVSRFIAEARAVNQIRHRNIIDIFAFGTLPDGRQYFVMELLDGMPLDRYLAERGRLAPAVAVAILRLVGRALDAAHASGIAHRDLKPENIFLTFDDDGKPFPKLLDFGIAKLSVAPTGGGDAPAAAKTKTGTPMGTPYYMSPEQCRGRDVDHRTDVYAFGIMCHELLTGSLPFRGDNVIELLLQHTQSAPPAMSSVVPELPPALDAPVLRMLAKEPSERPSTVGAAVEELARAAHHAGFDVPLPGVSGASSGGPIVIEPSAAKTGAGKSGAGAMTPAEVHELAAASTIASVSGASSVPISTFQGAGKDVGTPPRRSWLAWAATPVVLLGLAAGLLYHSRRQEPRVLDAMAPRAPSGVLGAGSLAPSAPSVPASAPSAIASPSQVAITLRTAPEHADVFLDGEKLGRAPGPFALPRGEGALRFEIRADGYKPAPLQVPAGADGAYDVALVRSTSRPAGAKPSASARAPARPDDLPGFDEK